jgi:RNA polymerase sigma-70 factor, ECF subfamily
MDDLTVILEEQRTHLRAVAYRLLGSVHEADDAVQETWLRLERSDVSDVDNLPAWLTTVVSRICLDQLRSRASRREELGVDPTGVPDLVTDPAAEAEYADAVGRALMVVLDTLAPAERLAFCLHDLFGLSFDEIAPTLGRSSAACRQLASRARRRVRGQGEAVEVDRTRQREVVEAFLDASRHGRFDRLLALLHPEAVMSADAAAVAMGSPALLSGSDEVARMFSGRAQAAGLTDLDGYAAAKWSVRGEVKVVLAFTVEDGVIREIELLAGDLERLDLR